MAENNSSGNTAIVAIVVLVLVLIIGFFAFNGGPDETLEEPDIEVNIDPGDAGGDLGADEGNGG